MRVVTKRWLVDMKIEPELGPQTTVTRPQPCICLLEPGVSEAVCALCNGSHVIPLKLTTRYVGMSMEDFQSMAETLCYVDPAFYRDELHPQRVWHYGTALLSYIMRPPCAYDPETKRTLDRLVELSDAAWRREVLLRFMPERAVVTDAEADSYEEGDRGQDY